MGKASRRKAARQALPKTSEEAAQRLRAAFIENQRKATAALLVGMRRNRSNRAWMRGAKRRKAIERRAEAKTAREQWVASEKGKAARRRVVWRAKQRIKDRERAENHLGEVLTGQMRRHLANPMSVMKTLTAGP